jgi:DMSO/TMAO reductase YedYZ molybdopterin-dependent catalytic subunit
LERFLDVTEVNFISDFHCVEGWSVWIASGRVRIRDIERIVKPLNVARAVSFESADNYLTSLFREELAGDEVLLAYKLNGELLEEGLGAPVRLIVPSKYAYKSALWVVRLRFTRN